MKKLQRLFNSLGYNLFWTIASVLFLIAHLHTILFCGGGVLNILLAALWTYLLIDYGTKYWRLTRVYGRFL